ncbi:MAG: transcription-repair coupling factor [bacterium]|nr:transcription-repair coupling factor [bacterium]
MKPSAEPPPEASLPEAWQAASRALRASAPYRSLRQQRGDVVRLPVPAAAWVLELLAAELGRPLLVLVAHEVDAYAWLEAAQLYTGGSGREPRSGRREVVYFPAPSLSPYQEAETSLLVRAEEAVAVDRIVRGKVTTVITSPRALYRRLPEPESFAPAAFDVAVEEEHPIDELVDHLVRWGYHRSDLVFEVGQFAVRGGVFDFFPPGQPMPIRLDLFGETVESIRRFEPESQRSGPSLSHVHVLPLALYPQGAEAARQLADLVAADAGAGASQEVAERITALREAGGFDGWEHYLPLLAEKTLALPDLLPEPLVVTFDHQALVKEVEHHGEILRSEFHIRSVQERLALEPERLEHPPEAVLQTLDEAEVRLGNVLVGAAAAIDFEAGLTPVMHDHVPLFPREVEVARARGDRVVLVTPDDHRPRIVEMLEVHEVGVGGDGVELMSGDLQRGFHLRAAGITVFGERQLLRRVPLARRARRQRYGPFLSSLRDLKIGDYVVHGDHGIGQFVALRNLAESDSAAPSAQREKLPAPLAAAAPDRDDSTEVMEIAYARGQRLLLPLERLDLIQKYSGIETVAPRLDRLGGTSWSRTKGRIKKGMRDMAAELLKLYAERELARAPQISSQSDLVQQFDTAFEYEETPDQLDAIEAIEGDLGRIRPMDRLLCGDVGFGKTEVAMRAAFKTVDCGYQVVILAPTTILADQHLATFRRRFADVPVLIDMISRFRTAAEVREVLKRVEAGRVDILIGTHRLLQREVRFPKLGLVIIDEEQRFGVAHKERLKKLRKDVHMLAMSATPVPRTLQLSLAGVRDLSLIETPPRDRMAVETAILPHDTQLIREAVEYEIERGGQVYYVYNRVESIERVAKSLREIIPGIKITVGHGQMDETELARRMHAFVAGEYHLLLATTIIENGIDIPNVNTMIVHRADRFGLAQLYQLRGRVGRSDQLAYCYLLVSPDRILTQEARKRLDAIRDFCELGAGFRVAGRDLEIRGAGNLLGAEQSGHIAAVGIETYLKMLEESVAELRGEAPEEAPSVALDLPVVMSIPEDYVGDPNLRLEIYRRLATGDEPEEEILGELRDRFGPPPDGVRSLVKAAAVKRLGEALRLQSISAHNGRLVLRLREDARVDPERLVDLVSGHPNSYFSPSGALSLEGVAASEALDKARAALEYLSSAPAG